MEFLKSQSPGLRQWWDIKAENFDTVIMFKVCSGTTGNVWLKRCV